MLIELEGSQGRDIIARNVGGGVVVGFLGGIELNVT
jgi:hypothetical protein